MKSTRSERGTNCEVRVSCSRTMAFVPEYRPCSCFSEIPLESKNDLTIVNHGSLLSLTVSQNLDFSGRRGHPFFQKLFSQQGIDHRALPRIELSNRDQQEKLIELLDGLSERLWVSGLVIEYDQSVRRSLNSSRSSLSRASCCEFRRRIASLSRAHYNTPPNGINAISHSFAKFSQVTFRSAQQGNVWVWMFDLKAGPFGRPF